MEFHLAVPVCGGIPEWVWCSVETSHWTAVLALPALYVQFLEFSIRISGVVPVIPSFQTVSPPVKGGGNIAKSLISRASSV
jgi:hypothetical protein